MARKSICHLPRCPHAGTHGSDCRLAGPHAGGRPTARQRLIEHSCERLRGLARKMLRRYPKVHRWEQTDDVFVEAVTRLHRALETVRPESPRHFYNLAATQIRRVLIDLSRRYYGPEGIGSHHDTAAGQPEADAAEVRTGRRVGRARGPGRMDRVSRAGRGAARRGAGSVQPLWYQQMTHEQAAEVLGVTPAPFAAAGRMPVTGCSKARLGEPLPGMTMTTETDDQFRDLLDRWEELREQGQEPSVEELCRDAPHLAERLREWTRVLKMSRLALPPGRRSRRRDPRRGGHPDRRGEGPAPHARRIHAAGGAGRRRDGAGIQGDPPQDEPHRRREAAAAVAGAVAGVGRAVPARNPGAGPAVASEHRRRPRRRRGRRHALLRHGFGRRRRPGTAGQAARSAARRAGAGLHLAGGPRAGIRPCPRNRPSRHQAVEPDPRPRRHGEDPRPGNRPLPAAARASRPTT